MNETIRAAGCVLWRRSGPYEGELSYKGGGGRWVADGLEICLVHRPKYDDWSHPKGKLKRGEEPLAGALREVREETGHTCTPGAVLPTVRYVVGGRPKKVDYWAAEADHGTFTANREVDRIVWLPPVAARDRLTQPRDRKLVDALLDALHMA
ncbi:NUDIX hydrolase [Streptomyces sp. SID14478]|uniref:NUDIX hydrolase n=1 Tax=Streptomyces sp. SID14478 TaxID=2706073 RepID=UPI0013D90689|nr:NUDIX hydrolase [Streptomyces sp. SID14478]NEB76816.1 NUDIX hydrolase [Streptomyces sp. SID14478]